MNIAPGDDATQSVPTGHVPPPLVQIRRRANYFIRHWRGELPLGVSYWMNGVLVNVLAVSVWIIPVVLTRVPTNYGWVLAWGGFWITLMLVNLWQIVGIWRSAGRHIETTTRSGWARTAQIVMVIWVLRLTSEFVSQGVPAIWESFEHAWWLNESGRWEIRILKSGTELELSGGIGFGMTKDLESSLDANPTVRLIHLNLGSGGLVDEAESARSLLRTRGLDTYTSSSCVSACTVVFMGGRERYVKNGARLGFHAFKKPGMYAEANQQILADQKSYLTSIGVPESFATRATNTPQPQIWYPTDDELIESGVVTAFTDGDEFALSGFGKVPDAVALDASFEGIRLYKVLKSRYPAVYQQMLDAAQLALTQGHSTDDLRDVTLPLLGPVLNHDIPYSSDEAVVRFTRVLVKQFEALQDAPGEVCMAYAMGGTPQASQNAAVRYFTPELRREEIEALAGVLETADAGRPMPGQRTIDSLLEQVYVLTYEEIGDDALALGQLNDPSLDPAVGCRAMWAF